MLTLPIVNRNRVFNIAVSLKNAAKVGTVKTDYNIGPSDILIHNNKYSESYQSRNTSTPKSVMEFIRSNAKIGKSNILISSKVHSDGTYNIYTLDFPKDKVTDGLDNLLGALILDLKNESDVNKGRYLDFKKIGVFDCISENNLDKISYLAQNMSYINITKYIEENNLRPLFSVLEIMNDFEFKVIKQSVVSQDDFLSMLEFFKATNSKDYYGLVNYYELAKENQKEYSKISKLNKIINNKPLELIQSDKKIVQKKEKVYMQEVA